MKILIFVNLFLSFFGFTSVLASWEDSVNNLPRTVPFEEYGQTYTHIGMYADRLYDPPIIIAIYCTEDATFFVDGWVYYPYVNLMLGFNGPAGSCVSYSSYDSGATWSSPYYGFTYFTDSQDYTINNDINNFIRSNRDVYANSSRNWQGALGFYEVTANDLMVSGSVFGATPEAPHFRYPVDYTPEIPNNWSRNKHSFGSLNNTGGVPHAAEDWNKTTGGCTDVGEPLSDIADGTVIDIDLGSSTDDWGKTILIQHDAPAGSYFLTGTGQMLSTVYSLYAHMLKAGQYEDQYFQDIYDSSTDIQQGEDDSIEVDDPVGQVGDGDGQYVNACHLHFEILTDVNQYRENPYGWTAMGYRTNPSELINNGLYSAQSTAFSIIVHPYECSDTFQLNDTTPNCNGSSSTIGNWTRRGGNYNPGNDELGYSGIIYSKPASDTGTASWTPNLPRDGQYRVWVYIPNSMTYASSENAEYVVISNSICYNPQAVNQSTNHGDWVDIGTYDLYQGDTVVSLEGDTDEVGKVIAIDAIKFEYVGSIQ